MKKISSHISFSGFAVFAKAQQENRISIGKTGAIFANILKEKRKILGT